MLARAKAEATHARREPHTLQRDPIPHHARIPKPLHRRHQSPIHATCVSDGVARREMAQPVIEPRSATVVDGSPNGVRLLTSELRDRVVDVALNGVHLCREDRVHVAAAAKRHAAD